MKYSFVFRPILFFSPFQIHSQTTMVPEKRNRKKTAVFDAHPPGSKHQMMSERSKSVVDKKLAKIRMRKVREQEKNGSKVEGAEAAQFDKKDVEPGASLVDGQGTSVNEPVGQSTDKK